MFNKKSKALIGSLALILMIFFVFILLIKPAFSAGENFTVKFDIAPSIVRQILYITITNNQASNDNLDMRTIINEANFDTSRIKNIVFSELKNVKYAVKDYETICTPQTKQMPNGTAIINNCVQAEKGSHEETRKEWQPVQQLWNSKSATEAKNEYNIVQIQSKETKQFRLEFDTPIVSTAKNRGSAGTVYLDLNGRMYVDKTHSSWWNATWTKRKPLYIKENTGSTLTNYPALINVNYDSDMNYDFNDLRVTDSNDNELGYWIQNKTDGVAATIYINATLPASANTTFYMYYGNNGAESASNTAEVFSFADDFDRANKNGLDNAPTGQTWTYQNNNSPSDFSINGGRLRANPTGDEKAILTFGDKTIPFELNFKWNIESGGDASWFVRNIGNSNSFGCTTTVGGIGTVGAGKFGCIDGAEWWVHLDVDTAWTTGVNYSFKIITYGNNNSYQIYINNEWKHNGLFENAGTPNHIKFNENQGGSTIYYIDNLFNRTYVAIQPTPGFGDEEFGDQESPKWSNSETNATDSTGTQQSAYFNITLTDNAAGGNYVFSLYNGTDWNNNSAQSWTSGQEISVVKIITATRNQIVKWKWFFSDAAGNSNQTDEWQFAVANTAPTQTKPILNSTSGKNFNNDNLTCYSKNTYDADNDNVVNVFNWLKNNEPLAVLNMPFETSAKDYSGEGNTGANYGATQTTGKIGNALNFDGINDYVEIADSSSLDITGNLTLEAWIKPSGIQEGFARILFKGDGDSPGVWSYTLAYDPAGNYIRLLTYTTNAVTSISPAVNTANQWYHVVGTYDGSAQKLYINGVEVDTDSQSGNLRNSGKLGIGAEIEPASERYFNGSIDEVKIYSKVLTPEQIQAHYNLEYNKIVAQETKGGDVYQCEVTPNDGFDDGLTNSSNELEVLWAVTFNVTSGEDGSQLNNFNINCNNSWSITGANSMDTFGFELGSYSCVFEKIQFTVFYNKTITFVVDEDKSINVIMSRQYHLTIQEHNQLDALYKCIIDGDCNLWNLLANINQTTSNIWQRIVRTNRDVIKNETFISHALSPTSNISVNYTIDIPLKEGYAQNELLPLRMFFWFTDVNKTRCFNQDKTADSNAAANPFCVPLMAETLGPNGGSVTFKVDLHPNLPDGTYGVVRSIEIDPIVAGQQTWINYGQDSIGTITASGVSGESDIALTKTSETKAKTLMGITGAVISSLKEAPQLFVITTTMLLTILAILVGYVLGTRKSYR